MSQLIPNQWIDQRGVLEISPAVDKTEFLPSHVDLIHMYEILVLVPNISLGKLSGLIWPGNEYFAQPRIRGNPLG